MVGEESYIRSVTKNIKNLPIHRCLSTMCVRICIISGHLRPLMAQQIQSKKCLPVIVVISMTDSVIHPAIIVRMKDIDDLMN